MKKAIAFVMFLAFLSACTQTADEGMDDALNDCSPFEGADYCTAEYNPVCAKLESGEWKTFGNSCSACISKEKVVGYKEGECQT